MRVSQRRQISCIFTDNVWILCLFCKLKSPKQQPNCIKKGRKRHRSQHLNDVLYHVRAYNVFVTRSCLYSILGPWLNDTKKKFNQVIVMQSHTIVVYNCCWVSSVILVVNNIQCEQWRKSIYHYQKLNPIGWSLRPDNLIKSTIILFFAMFYLLVIIRYFNKRDKIHINPKYRYFIHML